MLLLINQQQITQCWLENDLLTSDMFRLMNSSSGSRDLGSVFWNVTPFNLVHVYRHFGGTFCLHLHGFLIPFLLTSLYARLSLIAVSSPTNVPYKGSDSFILLLTLIGSFVIPPISINFIPLSAYSSIPMIGAERLLKCTRLHDVTCQRTIIFILRSIFYTWVKAKFVTAYWEKHC